MSTYLFKGQSKCFIVHSTLYSPQRRKGRRVNFSFHFLLRGQKVKNNNPSGNIPKCYLPIVTHKVFTNFGSIDLYVCRPLNGKHKTTILSTLCDSNERSEWAVKLTLRINNDFNSPTPPMPIRFEKSERLDQTPTGY